MKRFITSNPDPKYHEAIRIMLNDLHVKGLKEFNRNKTKHVKNQIRKRREANKRRGK